MKNTKAKKLMLIFLVIFFTILLYTNKIFAEVSVKIGAVGKIENEKNIITIEVETTDLQEIGEGINAYIVTLNYNTNQLEFQSASGENGWNKPSYNKESVANGKIKLVATRSDFSKDKGSILKITLKLKDGISLKNIDTINLSDISLAYKQNGKTDKIEVSDIQVKLDNSKITDNKEKSNNQMEQQEKLPQTFPKAGVCRNVITIVLMMIITYMIFLRYKNIKLK